MSFWPALLIALLLSACHEGSPSPTAGSNSNWLMRCDQDADCGAATSCQCGSCSRVCDSDADCAALAGARCVPNSEAAVSSLCRSAAASNLCLPSCEAGACGSERVCVLGACLLAAPPAGDFCGSVAPPEDAQRTLEDELLDAVEQMRLQGGVSCPNMAASLAGSALRFDPRLACAARVFAADLSATRSRSLTDSLGRSSTERMNAAGYVPVTWAEGFAYGAANASAALSSMLSDSAACTGLTNARLLDVGVAHVGDVDVVTVAAE